MFLRKQGRFNPDFDCRKRRNRKKKSKPCSFVFTSEQSKKGILGRFSPNFDSSKSSDTLKEKLNPYLLPYTLKQSQREIIERFSSNLDSSKSSDTLKKKLNPCPLPYTLEQSQKEIIERFSTNFDSSKSCDLISKKINSCPLAYTSEQSQKKILGQFRPNLDSSKSCDPLKKKLNPSPLGYTSEESQKEIVGRFKPNFPTIKTYDPLNKELNPSPLGYTSEQNQKEIIGQFSPNLNSSKSCNTLKNKLNLYPLPYTLEQSQKDIVKRCKPNFPTIKTCDPLNKKLNPSPLGYTSEESQKYKEEFRKQELQQQRYFNSPQIQGLAKEAKNFGALGNLLKPERENDSREESVRKKRSSATTKALNQVELEDKKKGKKAAKVPSAEKRKKLNQSLSKILTPKSAIMFLHELKPDCVYDVHEQANSSPPVFFARVDVDGKILGEGQGYSKAQAKNLAAENAIKSIVAKTMTNWSEFTNEDEDFVPEQKDNAEDLPWAGLASFAIYKMFNEWQNQDSDLPMLKPPPKRKAKCLLNAPTKKDLPANASELHPAVVLNMVNPGLTAIELERDGTPISWVKMGYEVNGRLFFGIGGNKKDAKKEAAKAVLESLYGFNYP